MPTNFCIHVDGSRVRTKNRSAHAFGWALTGTLGGDLVESAGAHQLSKLQLLEFGGLYEHVAFVQAVLFSHQLGVPPDRLTIFCDDEVFGYAPTWLHTNNYLPHRRAQVLKRLDQTVTHYFSEEARDLVLETFERSRIVKIKGHRLEVHQERADYLAKHQGKLAIGLTTEPALSFDAWLEAGILRYTDPNLPPETWHAPFVRSLEQRDRL